MTETELGKYFKPIEPDTRLPLLDKEILRAGALLRYDGCKSVDGKGVLHAFTTLGTSEPRGFQVWGTGALNNQLAKVAKRAVIFICYRGKLPSDDGSGVEVHQWTVSVSSRAFADLPDDVRRPFERQGPAIVAAIDAAAAEEARKWSERAPRGGNGAPRDDAEYYRALEQDGGR